MTVGFKELTRNIRTEALYLMSIYGHLQGGPKWHHFYTELRLNFRYTTCEMYTFHWSRYCSVASPALNIWCKNCRIWQLLWTITESINTLFPVLNFLNCVVTEVVLFSSVVFKTLDISQGNVATHLMCREIFSDSIIVNFLVILTVK